VRPRGLRRRPGKGTSGSSTTGIGTRPFLSMLLVAPALWTTGLTAFASSPYHNDIVSWGCTQWPEARVYKIEQNCDDGTEIDNLWYPDGYVPSVNCLGRTTDAGFAVGVRFRVDDLEQGQIIKYARLRLAAQGGDLTSHASLVIKGVDEDSPEPLSDTRRPSELPKVVDAVGWNVDEVWASTGTSLGLYHSSPNLADIINSILSRPNWGQGEEGKVVILTVEDNDSPHGETNCLSFEDFSTETAERDPAILEVYVTLADAFVGRPMLGRPTDTSITINMVNLLNIDVYVEYGSEPGVFAFSTSPMLDQPAQEPIEIVIDGLLPDHRYYYRIRYREPGSGEYLEGNEATFHTQRSQGSPFAFTIQADAQHLDGCREEERYARNCSLYQNTLSNVAGDNPDFHIDMGDFASTELRYRNAASEQESVERYLMQRAYLDRIAHSVPFYLVLGNHEGEQGWRAANEEDDLDVWSTLARKEVIPNPFPDGFYSGNQDDTPCCGLREDYYAWEWGDALFVVLDPFWYTMTKPHFSYDDGYPASNSGWDWTLGQDQYDWLYVTLHNSNAVWKFVFCHHLTGGVYSGTPPGTPYGRGGIEAVKYRVDGRPSFEWGGERADGDYVFDSKRPGWSHGTIHDMMVSEGVSILFHGHDHVFVHQVLDGVVYQACPQPHDSEYSDGFYGDACYSNGTACNNSGHLRITVTGDMVQVDYVRSVLPGHEPLCQYGDSVYNQDISHSYSISLAGVATKADIPGLPRLLGSRPNPFRSVTHVHLSLPKRTSVLIDIYDVKGRMVRRLLDERLDPGVHGIPWEGQSGRDVPLPPGVYFCRMRAETCSETQKIVLLK
jgi:hypothetical protein